MDPNDLVGEILEQGATVVKQTAKATTQAVSDTAKATASQITGSGSGSADSSIPPTITNEEVVESLYKTPNQQTQNPQAQQQMPANPPAKGSVNRTPEELANLEVVRKELHNEYYQNTFNRPRQEEERTAEKVEREEKEEMVDLQQKEMEKPQDLAQQRAAQRVEKFPGASG